MRVVKLRAPHRRVAVWAAVLGSASAFAPPAVAEAPALPTAPALPDPAVIVAAALTATQPAVTPTPVPALPAPASAVPPAVIPVPPEPESVPPADPATAAPLEPATSAPVDAVGETPSEAPVEAPVEAPAVAPDPPATPVTPVQETVEPGVEAAVEAVVQAVQQVQPVNINISVRADSPGDNGPVTQINAAVSAPLLVATPPEVRYQQPDSQYHDPTASSESPVAPAASADTTPTADAPAVPADSWDWTWTWSCGDAIAPAIVLPANYLQQIWNWNWNWNCGANENGNGNSESQLPSQYQPVTAQYQPINVNIAIRIASPGNDGPVVQANLAIAMPTLVLTAPTRPAPLPVPRSAPLPASGPPATPVPVEAIAQPAEAAVDPSELPSAQEQDTPSPAASPLSKTPNIDTTPIRSVLDRAPGLARPDTTPATTRTAPVAVVSVEAIAALARPAPAVAAGRRANAREQRAKTHARPITPKHAGVGALGYASIGPLGAGGSDRTLQLIFLIFVPFLFAFADAARRVAEERKAAAADSGRRREKPG